MNNVIFSLLVCQFALSKVLSSLCSLRFSTQYHSTPAVLSCDHTDPILSVCWTVLPSTDGSNRGGCESFNLLDRFLRFWWVQNLAENRFIPTFEGTSSTTSHAYEICSLYKSECCSHSNAEDHPLTHLFTRNAPFVSRQQTWLVHLELNS